MEINQLRKYFKLRSLIVSLGQVQAGELHFALLAPPHRHTPNRKWLQRNARENEELAEFYTAEFKAIFDDPEVS